MSGSVGGHPTAGHTSAGCHGAAVSAGVPGWRAVPRNPVHAPCDSERSAVDVDAGDPAHPTVHKRPVYGSGVLVSVADIRRSGEGANAMKLAITLHVVTPVELQTAGHTMHARHVVEGVAELEDRYKSLDPVDLAKVIGEMNSSSTERCRRFASISHWRSNDGKEKCTRFDRPEPGHD